MTLNPWEISIENGLISAYLHGTLDIDGLLTAVSGLKIPAGQTYAVGATDRAFLNTEAVTHAAIDTGVHGAGGSTIATVANIATHATLDSGVHGAGGYALATDNDIYTHNSDTTSVHGITDTSKLSVIASNTYVGNNTVNWARPHGLGVIPKFVHIIDHSWGEFWIHYNSTRQLRRDGGQNLTVTAWNSTNFYVINTAGGTNTQDHVYYWIAFG